MTVIEKQWKLVLGLFIAIIVIGGGLSFINIQKENREQIAQASYFMAEKKFLELKNRKNPPAPADPKAKAAPPVTEATPAEYAAIKPDFEKLIADYPHSKAAQMSSMYLADILVSEKNLDQALATLKKVESKDQGLLNTLVQQQIGQLEADKDQCAEAVKTWQKIIDRKEASFLHNDLKIQQALCYKKLNENQKAEEILTNLANQKTETSLEASATSKEASKYLRLLQFKKASGT